MYWTKLHLCLTNLTKMDPSWPVRPKRDAAWTDLTRIEPAWVMWGTKLWSDLTKLTKTDLSEPVITKLRVVLTDFFHNWTSWVEIIHCICAQTSASTNKTLKQNWIISTIFPAQIITLLLHNSYCSEQDMYAPVWCYISLIWIILWD